MCELNIDLVFEIDYIRKINTTRNERFLNN
jgi:hypothetical protein